MACTKVSHTLARVAEEETVDIGEDAVGESTGACEDAAAGGVSAVPPQAVMILSAMRMMSDRAPGLSMQMPFVGRADIMA